MDVLEAVGPHAADVGSVGKLLFIVVFVIPARAPAGGVTLSELLPRGAVGLLQRGDAADVENGGSEVEGEDLLVDNARSTTLTRRPAAGTLSRREREPNHERHTNARLVHGALIDHAVLAVQQAVVGCEDEQRVVELAQIFQRAVEPADAVVDGEDRAP